MTGRRNQIEANPNSVAVSKLTRRTARPGGPIWSRGRLLVLLWGISAMAIGRGKAKRCVENSLPRARRDDCFCSGAGKNAPLRVSLRSSSWYSCWGSPSCRGSWCDARGRGVGLQKKRRNRNEMKTSTRTAKEKRWGWRANDSCKHEQTRSFQPISASERRVFLGTA
jgi:hypothetical protein